MSRVPRHASPALFTAVYSYTHRQHIGIPTPHGHVRTVGSRRATGRPRSELSGTFRVCLFVREGCMYGCVFYGLGRGKACCHGMQALSAVCGPCTECWKQLHIHPRSKAASPCVWSVSVRLGNVPVDVKVACIRWQLDDHPVEFLGEYDLAAQP